MNNDQKLNLSNKVKNLFDSRQSLEEHALGTSVLMLGQQANQNRSSRITFTHNINNTYIENLSTDVGESINRLINQSNIIKISNSSVNFQYENNSNISNNNNIASGAYNNPEDIYKNNSNRNNALALSNDAIIDNEKSIKNLEFRIINGNENKIEFNCEAKEKYLIVKIKNNSHKDFKNTIYANIHMVPKTKTELQIEKKYFYIKPNEEKEWKIVLENYEFEFSHEDFNVELHFRVEEIRKEIKILSSTITIIKPE